MQLATMRQRTVAALGAHRGRVTCLAAHPASRKGAAASSDTLGLRRHLLASASVDWTCRLRVGSTPLGAPLDHGARGYVGITSVVAVQSRPTVHGGVRRVRAALDGRVGPKS